MLADLVYFFIESRLLRIWKELTEVSEASFAPVKSRGTIYNIKIFLDIARFVEHTKSYNGTCLY